LRSKKPSWSRFWSRSVRFSGRSPSPGWELPIKPLSSRTFNPLAGQVPRRTVKIQGVERFLGPLVGPLLTCGPVQELLSRRRAIPIFRPDRTKLEIAVQEPVSEPRTDETAVGSPHSLQDVHRDRPRTRPSPHKWGKLRDATSKFGASSPFFDPLLGQSRSSGSRAAEPTLAAAWAVVSPRKNEAGKRRPGAEFRVRMRRDR